MKRSNLKEYISAPSLKRPGLPNFYKFSLLITLMPLLGWKTGFENMEEFTWYALGLILSALGMKKYYDPDPKINETIHDLSQLDIRPKESLAEPLS